jgi:clan AA aspartic protease (TIGR02281 family)
LKNKNYVSCIYLLILVLSIFTFFYWFLSHKFRQQFATNDRCWPESQPTSSHPGETNRPETADRFSLPIVRKIGGVPVVEVSINGVKVSKIFDTGASHTLITPKIARQLNLRLDGTQPADTAKGKVNFALATIKRLQFGRGEAKNLQVSIADSNLETGLLGQDVFGEYEITIGKNNIKFRKFDRSPPPSSHIQPQY